MRREWRGRRQPGLRSSAACGPGYGHREGDLLARPFPGVSRCCLPERRAASAPRRRPAQRCGSLSPPTPPARGGTNLSGATGP